VETFLRNGGHGRPTVLCFRDRKLRGHAWKLSYGMEDKAGQLSSVVETGSCEDMRGNFPMEWRTSHANCPLL
jgi:hypothetical protein